MSENYRPPQSKDLPPDVFAIPEANLPRLEKRLSALARRAELLGLAPVTFERVGEHFVEIGGQQSTGFETPKRLRRYIHVKIAGQAPKIAGWTFVAALDHLLVEDQYENVVRNVPGIATPAPETYRKAQPLCQHCGSIRRRTKTYVLLSDAGDWKQVGSDCLRDFLGHSDPAAIAALLETLWETVHGAEDDDDLGFTGSGQDYTRLIDVLTKTVAVVRVEGWASRKAENESSGRIVATSSRVSGELFGWRHDKPDYPVIDSDKVEAESALAWAKTLADDGHELSDYEHNLCLIARVGAIDGLRHFGLAVSIIAAYRRSIGIALYPERRERKPSAWQGAVGERITRTLSIVKAVETESDWGRATFYVLTDADDNDYVWYATRAFGLQVGDTASIKATVKSHDEYNGRQQTRLTRGKIDEASVVHPALVPQEAQ